jgi:hypothetical protein
MGDLLEVTGLFWWCFQLFFFPPFRVFQQNRMYEVDPNYHHHLPLWLLHHAETVIIGGKSYRMKDQIETP